MKLENSAEMGSVKKQVVIVVCNDSAYFLRHRRAVADDLCSKEIDVIVITGGVLISADQRGDWRYINIPIARFTANLFLDIALAINFMRRILLYKPDAVHLITLKPAVICGLSTMVARLFTHRPSRIIVTIPGLGRLMSGESQRNRLRDRLFRRLAESAIRLIGSRQCTHFTFETNHDRNVWVRRGLIRELNSSVISGAGVNSLQFFPSNTIRVEGPLRVLFASRLLTAKGINYFISVAKRMQTKKRDIEFIVAGFAEPGDPDSCPLVELEEESAITFLGEISDMASLLRKVDLVCLPTKYGEGIPRILIEAAATGIPCVTSDVPGCCEFIQDGITGIIVPFESSKETILSRLEAAILYYSNNPESLHLHGEAARRNFILGDYSEAAVVGRFAELLLDGARIHSAHSATEGTE